MTARKNTNKIQMNKPNRTTTGMQNPKMTEPPRGYLPFYLPSRRVVTASLAASSTAVFVGFLYRLDEREIVTAEEFREQSDLFDKYNFETFQQSLPNFGNGDPTNFFAKSGLFDEVDEDDEEERERLRERQEEIQILSSEDYNYVKDDLLSDFDEEDFNPDEDTEDKRLLLFQQLFKQYEKQNMLKLTTAYRWDSRSFNRRAKNRPHHPDETESSKSDVDDPTSISSSSLRLPEEHLPEEPLDETLAAHQDESPGRPTVVLVHGAAVGSLNYIHFQEYIAAQGYPCVIYDQFARGFSDRLHSQLSTNDLLLELGSDVSSRSNDFFTLLLRQLGALLDHLEEEEGRRERPPTTRQKFVLYGVSMGATIVARFAAMFPERILGLGFQVPVVHGLGYAAGRTMMYPLRIPLLRDVFARFVLARRAIRRSEVVVEGSSKNQTAELVDVHEESTTPPPTPSPAEVARYIRASFEVHGTEADFVEVLTDDAIMWQSSIADHQRIAARAFPVLVQYAIDDREISRHSVESDLLENVYGISAVNGLELGHDFRGIGGAFEDFDFGNKRNKKQRRRRGLVSVEKYTGGHFMAAQNFQKVSAGILKFLNSI
ncbi:unnamed protein product [Amoebophrya sp. A25]|nr:unnamed protein product [Amoebophrya sp. A25]|eukprot:GSA25T00007046001.1